MTDDDVFLSLNQVCEMVCLSRAEFARREEDGVFPKRILPPSSTTDVGFSKKIRELERLRRDGLISDEEFEKKKRSILGVCEGRVVCVGLRSAKPAAPLGEDALLPGASQVVALPGQLVQRIEFFARH